MAELPLVNSVPRFITNEDRIDQWVNGDANTTVELSTGNTIPSLSKLTVDIDTDVENQVIVAFNAAANGLIQSVTDEADRAVAAANSATLSANTALGASDIATNASAVATSSANTAQVAANTAVNAANSASISAVSAANSESQAANSALHAANSASIANSAAANTASDVITVTGILGNVSSMANTVSNNVIIVSNLVVDAETAANTSVLNAGIAVNAANSASIDANTATQAANAASTSEINAANSEIQAANSAAIAVASANTASTRASEASVSAIASANSAAKALVSENNVALAAVPIGTLLDFPIDNIPAGYLRCNGATFDEEVYTDLYNYLGTNVLPNIADRVKRMTGPLAGDVGDTQEDAGQRLSGSVRAQYSGDLYTEGVFGGESAAPQGSRITGDNSTASGSLTFDSARSPGARVSDDETRVKAFIVVTCIKAYGATINQGTADIAAIEQAYANTQGQLSALPFQEYFESDEQIITAGGSLSLAHGLSTEPKLVSFYLKCITAENGYSVNDIIYWGSQQTSLANSALDNGLVARLRPTLIQIRYGSQGTVFRSFVWSTGAGISFTNSSWRLIVRAWA